MRVLSSRRLVNQLTAFAIAIVMIAAAASPGEAAERRLAVLGDSLTAGYGLPREDAFPARLEAALRGGGRDVQVLGAGVSGDTTAGGRARLAWTLADGPDAMIVILGGNDGLRGLDPAVTHENLRAILAELKAKGIPVMLAGMKAPPNLGPDYGAAFDAVYPHLAEAFDVVFYPFFLEGVAAVPALNQDDGIHPNRAGVDEIVRRILPEVTRLLARLD